MRVVDPDYLAYVRLVGVCIWCGRRGPVEAAHILARGMGGGAQIDSPLNVVPLCRAHHQTHHDKNMPNKAALWAKVEEQLGLEPGQAEDAVRRLLRKRKRAVS